MSRKHPIISITGSSGAGTTSVKRTFEQIFHREGVKAVYIEGDAFHRYDRAEMRTQMAQEARVPNALAILHAFAANCGAMVVALPDQGAVGEPTFSDLASAAKEFAEFISACAAAAADGRVTGNELRDIDRELADLIACAHKVRSGLAAIHAAEAQRVSA